jgi:hypothetical protein
MVRVRYTSEIKAGREIVTLVSCNLDDLKYLVRIAGIALQHKD